MISSVRFRAHRDLVATPPPLASSRPSGLNRSPGTNSHSHCFRPKYHPASEPSGSKTGVSCLPVTPGTRSKACRFKPVTPDLSIVARSGSQSESSPTDNPTPFGPIKVSPRACCAPISGLHHGASSRCFHSCRTTFDPLLAHPSRVSHKLPIQALFLCDLAAFWPSYGSLTNRSTIGRSTLPASSARFRRPPEP
jgi:hypothetical protein